MKQTAGVLLVRQRKSGPEILLVHDRKKWSIPKGGLEGRETPEQGARRELLEETALVISGDVIPIGYVDYKKENKRLHGFFAEIEGPLKITLSGELIQGRFVPLDEAYKLLDVRQRLLLGWVLAGTRAA